VLVITTVSAAVPGTAAAVATRNFNLPADVAEKSLPRFAEQSGLEVVFATETVGKVRTNAVQGEFTAREAMDRLLSRTGLVAAQNSSTGALLVSRDPNGQRAAQTTASDRPPRQNQAPIPTAAEVRAAAGAPSPGNDDAVVLSPFVVDSERDTGYQARNTLAGTRLNTRLEDVGAAISVYNRDFIDDIGAIDHNELLIYATGMEASGAQGNLSGLTANINNTATTTTREDPEGGAGFGVAIRTRGLSVPTRTRGFFATDIPSDSYNSDRVTVNRGPNAILFGVGNPGGIIDSTLMQARLGRNTNKVQTRYGDNDSLRASFDFIGVLIRGKLAARIAALYSREEYDQRPAFEEKRRLFGTATFEPFRSTAVRASFETGRGNANRVFTVPANDEFTPWLNAGRRAFDWTFYDDPARNPAAASQNVQNFTPLELVPNPLGDRVVAVYSDPSGATPPAGFSNRIRLHVPNAGVAHPVFNRDAGVDNFQFVGTRPLYELPALLWPGGQIPPGLRATTFTDYSAFPWNKRQFYESSRQPNSFNTFNVAIEQRTWQDRIGIELAYDRQRFHTRNIVGGRPETAISVDTNVTLPTGQPNHNLGRPYTVVGGLTMNPASFNREGLRGMAYAKYDFKQLGERAGRWLGHHVLTGLLEQTSLQKIRGLVNIQVDGPAALQASADILNGARNWQQVIYLGPSVIGNNNPVRLESVRTPLPTTGQTFPTAYYNPASGALETAETRLVEWAQGGSAFRDVVKSQAFALQSYWLQEHLVTLVGWRRDRDYYQDELLVPKRTLTRIGPNDPGTAFFGHRDFDFKDTPPFLAGNEIISYSAVLKWPRRLVKLPAGTEASFFYTKSDNFTPTGGRNDTFGQPLDPPTGATEEYGLNLSALGGRLNVRIGHFETAIVNQTIISGGLPVALAETGVTNTVDAWTREGNRNPANVPFMNAAIAALMSPLPQGYLDYRNFTVSGSPPDITTTFDRPQASDTTDFTSRGTELELTFNPTRNWRMMANVARAETIQTNVYPVTRAMLELLAPAFDAIVTDPATGVRVPFREIPKGGYPEGFGPANPPGPGTERYGAWLTNNILFPLAGFRATEGFASPEQRKWRVNFVTNYDFGPDSPFGSRLKGWGIGGGYRWQSKITLGYPSSVDANGVAHFDIDRPFLGDAETNLDLWVSYKRRLWAERIDWKVQLSVKNVLGGDDLIPVRAQPWGDIAVARVPPEKRWYLTNTFSF
jgi:hypothetical protein